MLDYDKEFKFEYESRFDMTISQLIAKSVLSVLDEVEKLGIEAIPEIRKDFENFHL